jgi:hypothetical protein
MTQTTWPSLVAVALGSGLTVKALDILYQEFVKRSDRKKRAASFIRDNLDPLLKAADELVGKIRSLADEDFKTCDDPEKAFMDSERAVVAYLFSSFWARVEILRRESLYLELSQVAEGKRLLLFLTCLESKRIRLLDRARQRAIGELCVDLTSHPGRSIPFVQFVSMYEREDTTKQWLGPILEILAAPGRAKKQRILVYGVVLHSLIDSLDPKHLATKNRPSYPSKLTIRSKRALAHRVFRQYLPFAGGIEKYTGIRLQKALGPPRT